MAAHYLPNLRKIITKKKKEKPARIKLSEPLDFHTERSRVSTTSSGFAHGSEQSHPIVPLGNRLRPQLLGQRVAAAVPVPEELRHWAQDFPWQRVVYAAVALALIVGICAAALFVAQHWEVEQPICDEACMEYTKFLGQTMDWSAAPCQDFHRFVCGNMAKNATPVRHRINRRFISAVITDARQEDVPAEGQTASQKAARLFKTCDDVVTQDTDYVPRIRGYMRDANLHWPQHPATRDTAAVDVLETMLELSDKWGWPCFFEFSTEGVRDARFELHVQPTIHLEQFQDNAISLGPGSPAHRKYFETLYAHYGGGVTDGVTFEEMLNYEAEVIGPLLSVLFLPPEPYVYERDPSETSGMWERWTTTVARHYDLAGNELIEIVPTNRQYFDQVLLLIATKEEVVELVIGWLCVQFTSWFSNRQLIANFHNYPMDAEEQHRRVCLAYTISLTGIALFVPVVRRIYTEPVREDASRIARAMRRTVYQTLDEATYPWLELGSVFRYLDIALVTRPRGKLFMAPRRFAHFPDMEASFVKNQRDANKATRLTNIEAIGFINPTWMLVDDLFLPRSYSDRVDYVLKPSILTFPMYYLGAPMPVRLGTFGVEVAKATLQTYDALRFEGHKTTVLDRFRDCIFAAVADKASLWPADAGPEWIHDVEDNVVTGAALDVALSVLKQVPSFDTDRLTNVPLTGHQLFYVIHCYTYCGYPYAKTSCNDPLRHKEDFAEAFSCPTQSHMRSKHQCKGF
ncbi:hypothetical protein HPB50_011347 [Hyalomma asiaticum]|uniref:Uncharacterized protein n=1 Tax=Hyalomma asiaticum TaxID=266040 RepID=A0ACB7T798_HYAAI|nr:hypothetical protein HPB50_011347 [Hyalomma asiaticum]